MLNREVVNLRIFLRKKAKRHHPYMSWFIYVSIKVGHANEFAYSGIVMTIVRLEDEGMAY